jgi:DNA invertase Pin-like site-specific DNA recombinase
MNVAVYPRVSSRKQAEKELSIPGQLKALGEYATRNGQTVVREFVDEAESGRSSDRKAFKEMIAQSCQANPPFEAILVWKLSRFARNREDSIVYKSLLRKKGVQVISVNEPIEDSPAGRLLEGVIEVIDEFYSDNLAQDVTRGMKESATRGFYTGGKMPYGLAPVKVQDGGATRTKLEPDETTAPVVRRIFSECLGGKGALQIAKGLNADGIPSPAGKLWLKGAVSRVISNEAAIGTLVWGRRSQSHGTPPVRVPGAWKPIVDDATFAKAQRLVATRSPKTVRPRSVTSDYLLSGTMRCAVCGSSIIGTSAKSGRALQPVRVSGCRKPESRDSSSISCATMSLRMTTFGSLPIWSGRR